MKHFKYVELLPMVDAMTEGFDRSQWTADMNYADCLETPEEFDKIVDGFVSSGDYEGLYGFLVDVDDLLKQHCSLQIRFWTEQRTFDLVDVEEFLENPQYYLNCIYDDGWLYMVIKNKWD